MEHNFDNNAHYFKDGDYIKGLTVGDSMYPLFKNQRDIVTVKKITDGLRVNDVLLYKSKKENELILHRLLKITDNGFVIRGDNRYIKETDVKPQDIVGVMVAFERKGKYCECDKSVAYKLYVVYIRLSYPVRRLIHKAKSFIRLCKIYYNKKIRPSLK